MPRAYRAHAPGSGFHITARVQNGAFLFTEPLRHSIAAFLCEAATFCGSDVLALVVMPNHFHVVLKQGTMPLGWLMQRAIQRTALLVRRSHGGEGHVFGRRYWSCVCAGPEYLRHAVVYTHLNPWKAGLCSDPADYPWSSHALIENGGGVGSWNAQIAREKTRLLFANEDYEEASITENYRAYVAYAKLRYKDAIPGDRFLFDWSTDWFRPRAPKGDEHWAAEYSQVMPAQQRRIEQRDIRDRAVAVLRLLASDCTLDMLRLGGRSVAITKIRRELIAVLHTSGYRRSAIARVLYVSPSMVSDVIATLTRP